MGLFRYSVIVIVGAVVLSRLPGWFQEKVTIPPVTGTVQPGWEHVRDVYSQIFANDDDRGSSLSVYHKGELVVDLRGGFANEKELWPWQEDTISRLFSTSKAVSAICIAVLVDRGLLNYSKPVVNYWPEFGANGKEHITVEELLSHQAGLFTITDESYSIWDEIKDIKKTERLLAAQKPLWKPGSGVGYHAMTIGMYMDQLVRHADSKHRGLPQFFKEEIAKPFGIDIQYGLVSEDVYRCAVCYWFPFKLKFLALPFVRSFLYHSLFGKVDPDVPDAFKMISKSFHDKKYGNSLWTIINPEVNGLWNPSGMAYGNAKSLAKLFGILSNGGSAGGKTIMSSSLVQSQTDIIKSGIDKVIGAQLSYGRGYTIATSPKGSSEFGSPGMGGQMGYGDPIYKLGIGFVTNYLGSTGLKDHRYIQLEEAIYKCVDKSS